MTWNKKRITPIIAALIILSALITVSLGQPPESCIEIEKRINGEDFVYASPGDTLEVTLWVHNCGDVNLTDLRVHDNFPLKKSDAGLTWTGYSDPMALPASSINATGWIHFTLDWMTTPPLPEPLQPGEDFTITFGVTVDEFAEGALENCAIVTANYTIVGVESGTINDTDCATVFVPSQAPALTPTGLIALVSLLAVIALLGIRKRH
jgi:hypothetical protein